jgi:cytochrome bd-type quinol oxidase subunit 2
VELFLNFIWVVVSLALFVLWTRTAKRTSARKIARAAVALLLLIVVLLPIISATDDMASMAGLLEGEHSEHIVRRGELLLDLNAVTPISLILFTILFVDLAFLRRLLTRVVLRSKTEKLMKNFVMVAGIRPPPAAFLVSA